MPPHVCKSCGAPSVCADCGAPLSCPGCAGRKGGNATRGVSSIAKTLAARRNARFARPGRRIVEVTWPDPAMPRRLTIADAARLASAKGISGVLSAKGARIGTVSPEGWTLDDPWSLRPSGRAKGPKGKGPPA
jgi:hypothetical protein